MNRIKIAILVGVCILGLSSSAIVMAETSNRRANIKSQGNIEFGDGEVYIASSDLIYLADEIDTLENTYKQRTVDALNHIGTFFLQDGSIVYDAALNEVDEEEEKTALSFGTIVEGINKSQSVENFPQYRAAVANNLSAGTAAWVNGELVKGTGEDNENHYNNGHDQGYKEGYDQGYKEGNEYGYNNGHDQGYKEGHDQGYNVGYEQGYAQGFVDGQQNMMNNLQITYTYHTHTGSAGNGCYTKPVYHQHTGNANAYGGCYTVLVEANTVYGDHVPGEREPISTNQFCKLCRTNLSYYDADGDLCYTEYYGKRCKGNVVAQYYTYGLGCGMTTSTITDYVLGCGKTEETIETATIIY